MGFVRGHYNYYYYGLPQCESDDGSRFIRAHYHRGISEDMFGIPDGVVRFITTMRYVLGPETGQGFEERGAFMTWGTIVEVVERRRDGNPRIYRGRERWR